MDIKLNLINRSNDVNNSQVVIFQKNQSPRFTKLAVAWQVIQNCGRGDNHPFTYSTALTVGAYDSSGNYTRQLAAQDGQVFHMTKTRSGDELSYCGQGSSADEIQIRNDLLQGVISANVFKADKLFATVTDVAPGHTAIFEFAPKLAIGVASRLVEGQLLDPSVISDINAEISLSGIASADIVMTGGGTGRKAMPFVFSLQNIVMV